MAAAYMTFLPRSVREQASKVTTPAGLAATVLAAALGAALAMHFQPFGRDVGMCMLPEQTVQSTTVKAVGADKQFYTHDAALGLLDTSEKRCTFLIKEVETLQKQVAEAGVNALPKAAALLGSLQDFDAQNVEAMSFVERAHEAHPRPNSTELSSAERQIERAFLTGASKRTSSRICFLRLVTAARHLAASLPQEDGNYNGALGCENGLLGSLEARAVKEAEAEENANALTHLGAHWSELAVYGRSAAPIFGLGVAGPAGTSADFVRDSWGTMAPGDLVHAEGLLARANEALGSKRSALTTVHASRLEAHAKTLEGLGQFDAAEQRYRAISKLAKESNNAALSAQALAQLSLSLKIRGSAEEALVVALDAVELTMNPLAQFVLTSTRLSSGLLTTEASVKAAAGELKRVAGQLPDDDLEIQRKLMHTEMLRWGWVAQGDMSKCTVIRDAPRFLICVMCKLIY